MSRNFVGSGLAGRRRVRASVRGVKRLHRPLQVEPLEHRWLLATDPGISFLQQAVEGCHRSPNAADLDQPVVYLYSDYWSGCTYGSLHSSAMTLDGNDPDAGQGVTSLRASWNGTGVNGWFQFWIGDGQTNRPRDIPEFGQARYVRFLAKGDTPGQDILARIFKVPASGGWELVRNVAVDLSTAWQDFAVDLNGLNLAPHDLHAVQFVIGDGTNDGGRTFWVDEVRVETDGFDPLRVPISYRAQFGNPASGDVGYRDALIYPNRSFLYDAALTIKALLAAGDADSVQMARQVTDALVATKLADGSYFNDRNCGHVLLGDGTPRASFSQRRTLGDQAWFGLALLDVYRQSADVSYLERAIEISNWAEANLKDSGAWKGYRGGYDEGGNPYAWRATEHNIDLFALNRGIDVLLSLRSDAREAAFATRTTHAGDFVMHMFDDAEGKFWTGTGAGDTINQDSVPLDAQTWSLLTLARLSPYAERIDWQRVADWVEGHLQVCDGTLCGLTYSDQSTPNVVWLEGTAQAAVVAWAWRQQADYAYLIGELEEARAAHPNGDGKGIVAASRDTLLDDPLGAVYDARLHAGATAWTYFATAGINPLLHETDCGDAPDPSYPTLLASDGARHAVVPGVHLGALIDGEDDGQFDPDALGDDNNGTDDEDGVRLLTAIVPGNTVWLEVTASVNGYLNAWLDGNDDGDWDDPGEHFAVNKSLLAGVNQLSFAVPAGAVLTLSTFARFRFSTAAGLSYTGLAPDGEVEDYEVAIESAFSDDIVGRNQYGYLWVAENCGCNAFSSSIWGQWSTARTWKDVMAGDFNGDGYDDVVARNEFGYWWVAASNGSNGFTSSIWGKWEPSRTWTTVMVGDFNRDGFDDLVGRNEFGYWWVAVSNGSGGFSSAIWGKWDTARTWTNVMVGDFNADGRSDLVARNEFGYWWVAASNGSNAFSSSIWGKWDPARTWSDVMVGDFNADGADDLVGRNNLGYWWVAKSHGSNSFSNAIWGQWSTTRTWTDVMVGDFDGNGAADVVGRNDYGYWWVAKSNGTDAFTNGIWGQWDNTRNWVDVMVGDFNRDGNADVVGRDKFNYWWVQKSNGWDKFANEYWGKWNAVDWFDVLGGDFGT